jgi:Tol biopolymer transport system component
MRALLTTVVVAALLSPALPSAVATAAAAPPVQHDAWAFVDNTHDDILRLQQPGGAAPPLSAPASTRHVVGLAVSQDGRRFVSQQFDTGTGGHPNTDLIRVRAADGTLLMTYDDGGYFGSSFNYVKLPELSPAGGKVAFTNVVKGSTGVDSSIKIADVRTGAATLLTGSQDLTALAWLDPHWLLATGPTGVVTVPVAGGGTRQPVTGLTADDSQFAVSPHGTALTWSRRTSGTGSPETADVMRGALSVSETGVATVSAITVLATGSDNTSPTWSRDGRRIDFIKSSGSGGSGSCCAPGYSVVRSTGQRATVPAAGGSVRVYPSGLSASQVVDLYTPPVQHDPWAFIDTSHDSPVLRLQQPGGPAAAITSPSSSRSLDGLTVSRDGHRFAYLQLDSTTSPRDPNAQTNHSQLVVRNATGALVRVAYKTDYYPTNVADFRYPQLSPAGTRVVASHVERGQAPTYIGLFDLTNGASTTLRGSTGLFPLAWLTQRWLLASGATGLVTMSASGGGPHQAVTGLTTADQDFAVSPDGHRLAWSRVTTGDTDVQTADVYVGNLAVSDTGVATVTGATRLATGQDNVRPSWSRDGLRLEFVRTNGIGFDDKGKRATVPADGSGSAAIYPSSLYVSFVVDLFHTT